MDKIRILADIDKAYTVLRESIIQSRHVSEAGMMLFRLITDLETCLGLSNAETDSIESVYEAGTAVVRSSSTMDLHIGKVVEPTQADLDRARTELRPRAQFSAVLVQWAYNRTWEYASDLRVPYDT